MCFVSKEQSILSRERIQNAFFLELCPFLDSNFFFSIKHPTAERWHPHAVLFLHPLLVLIIYLTGLNINWVPRGSVVRCLIRNPGVLGSSRTRSSGFFRGSVLGQDTSEPSLVLVKPRKA